MNNAESLFFLWRTGYLIQFQYHDDAYWYTLRPYETEDSFAEFSELFTSHRLRLKPLNE